MEQMKIRVRRLNEAAHCEGYFGNSRKFSEFQVKSNSFGD